MSYAGIRARVESHTVTSWLRSVTRTFAVRYPLTLLFAVAIILILSIGSWILISKTAQGANKQLIHTLETEIEKDLAGDLDRLRLSGVDISIDLQDSADQLDTWIAEVSKDIGASVAVLFDLDGIPIWSSNPAYPESGDLEADNVEIALAGGVVTELEFDVRLVGTDGRYYISGAMETYLPLFTASGGHTNRCAGGLRGCQGRIESGERGCSIEHLRIGYRGNGGYWHVAVNRGLHR